MSAGSSTRRDASCAEAPEQEAGPAQRSIEAYPHRLHAKEMAELFGFSLKRFYRLEQEGTFIQFEERPRIGNRKAWLRALVAQHLNGQCVDRRAVHVRRKPQTERRPAINSAPLHID